VALYTIGFTKKIAKEFFTLINENSIDLLVDIRLNNKSQLAGFTKSDDLEYFLKEICNCAYIHCYEFAPTKEILDAYKRNEIDWEEYEVKYVALMKERGDYTRFVDRFSSYKGIVLLCSEPTADRCHRRLLAELIRGITPNLFIYHI